MEKALIALNEIVSDGVIADYAIGGAIGASFFIEAVNTEDIDAFIFMDVEPNGLLSLSPIYDALVAKGGVVDGEHVVIDGWPIQILPAYKPLVEEALIEAVKTFFGNVQTKVFSAEFLCAVALDTGRIKDYYRVASFIEQGKVDIGELFTIAKKYELMSKLIEKVSNWPGVSDVHAG